MKYSFLTEHTSGFFKQSQDSEGKPNGFDAYQHTESPDGKMKSTSFSSSRKWSSGIKPSDIEDLEPMFQGFHDDLDNCDNASDEDMCIKCNIIPTLKYKFAHHCNGLSDKIKDIFRNASQNISDDLLAIMQDPNKSKDDLKEILSSKYICDAD